MRNSWKLLIITGMAFFITFPSQAKAYSPYLQQLKIERMFESLIDNAIESEKTESIKENIKSLKRLELIIGKNFAYDEIFERIFGIKSSLFTEYEKTEVKELMVKTLKILFTGIVKHLYSDEKRTDIGAKGLISNDKMRVKITTKVKLEIDEYSIEYVLYSPDKVNYKIVDIVIEGVSVVDNYRVQVLGVISKHSHNEVLDRLRTFHHTLAKFLES